MISNLTVFFCVIWAVALLYGEKFAFHWTCSWPMDTTDNPGDYMKIAVVADPQLMDRTSLGLAPKSLVLEIVQFYTDIFMRRAMLGSIMPLKPDKVLFLGDYFDGGHVLSDEEWQDSLNRFRHIFDIKTLEEATNNQQDLNPRPPKEGARNNNLDATPTHRRGHLYLNCSLDLEIQRGNLAFVGSRFNKVYFLSGNHDIGYAAYHSRKPEVIRRYKQVFGPRNYVFGTEKVEFVAVDAQTLDGHPQQSQTSASWNFVDDVSRDTLAPPRVLLTHIPLYRPDGTSCGSKRSSPIINQRISRAVGDHEIMYQNYLTEETTNKLLNSIKPVLILSGHDHDQCTVTHKAKHGDVVEHTLGTISWQQGNLYPSFMLLTVSKLAVSNATDVVSTRLCLLPAQLFIYIWYIFLFVVTLVVILVWPTNGLNIHLRIGENMRNIIGFFKSNTKEKDEDENCEYEMVWDAEGSMHLIKKPKKIVPLHSSERVERGNATMRLAAKKQIMQEVNVLMPQEVSGQPGLDAAARLGPVKTKSKVRFVIRRLVRVFQVISVVAAVNVPIYIMLLFADWIDK